METISRVIKFRAWDRDHKRFIHFDFTDLVSMSQFWSHHGLAENGTFVYQQYTGLKDKNAKDIYEGDIIKNQYEAAQLTHEWSHEEQKQVEILQAYKIYTEINPVTWNTYDNGETVFHITCWMWGSRSLSEILFAPTDYTQSFWQIKNNYFEIIGNVCENPELLPAV